MITRSSTGEEIRSALYWYFDEKTQPHEWPAPPQYLSSIQGILGKSFCKVKFEELFLGSSDLLLKIYFFVPPTDVEFADGEIFASEITTALRYMFYGDNPLHPFIIIKVLAPEELKTVGLNNCFFKRERTITHDELRFRSKAEIKIYDELKSRDVLFFPNPAAILGCSASEYGQNIEKREPDFLICYKGKWGILEINGDEYHSGIIKTTKDHEKARRFQRYGIFFIQAYDADKCRGNPLGVVDEFLMLLGRYKA